MQFCSKYKEYWECTKCGSKNKIYMNNEKCFVCYPKEENALSAIKKMSPFSTVCFKCKVNKHKIRFKRNGKWNNVCNECFKGK
jgi:hypothetical protein